MKKIVVGSTSVHKIEAVKEALLELGIDAEVFGVKTESGANAQPMGFEEMFKGAVCRAFDVYLQRKDNESITLGIENGILYWNSITIDIAVIAIRSADGKYYVSTSPGIQFPERCTRKTKKLGFESHTVGEIIAKDLGGDRTDPHLTLTHGRISRKEILVQGVNLAFAQVPDLKKFFE